MARTRAELLRLARRRLAQRGVPNPLVEARALLAWALGTGEGEVLLDPRAPVPDRALKRLERGLARRLAGEPLSLVVGRAEFWGLELATAPGVFLPRPETEGLVELALRAIAGRDRPRVLDVGTGSGAVALAIKRARPDAQVLASDTSRRALRLARENARRLGLEVEFLHAPLLAGLTGLDLVVANPPYLPEAYRDRAPRELSYEPEEALYAGEDGLAVARPLLCEARGALRPGGSVLLELDPTNAALLGRFALGLGLVDVCTLPDLAGRPRYLLARAPAAEPAG